MLLLDASKQHFLKFEEVLGKPIPNVHQPSLVATPTDKQKQVDEDRKLLVKYAL